MSRRSSPRAEGFDYSTPGAYFYTTRTHDGVFLFGEVIDGIMTCNAFGEAVEECWMALPRHYPLADLDAFVVMPNHVHGIVVLNRKGMYKPPEFGLSEIVGALKSFSTRRVNELRETPGASVWQRSYYDHIIRDDHDLERVRGYIEANPSNWRYDSDNPMSEGAKKRRIIGSGERT